MNIIERIKSLFIGEIRYLGDMQRLRMEPGDIVVLSVAGVITDESASRIRRLMEERLPGTKCIVLPQGMRIGLLNTGDYRTEGL